MLFGVTSADLPWVVKIIQNALRGLYASLCKLIYPLISIFYQVFSEMGQLLYNDSFSKIYNKISTIIGVFMVFRVIFWLIELLVNPDLISDKEKNPGKIVQKVLLSVVLLATTPRIFKLAFDIQYEIIHESVIEDLIALPSDGNSGDVNVYDKSLTGRRMASELFFNFYSYNDNGQDDNDNCRRYFGKDGIINSGIMNNNTLERLDDKCLTLRYEDSGELEGEYKINFNGLFAVGIGIFVFWMILMYCISVGTRYVQLIFLQIIAPIPIMCYLTPKKDNMFSKWVKQCTTTYLDLFIRVSIISFVLLLINQLFDNPELFMGVGDKQYSGWITIFLVLGLLTFAKKAPDLIQELLPKSVTKASGDFGLSWKKRTDAMLGGKLVYNGTKKAVGFAAAAPLALAKNVAVRGYNAAKYNERQNKKANDYRNDQIEKLQNAKTKMENSQKYKSLSAAEQKKLSNNMQQRIDNMTNRSTSSIRRELKNKNRNLQYAYANISDSDPNAKEKRAKLMEQITANSDMIGYRNQAITLATSLLGGLTAAGGAAIHENGIGKIIKKSSETETQRINREQGWFKDNPATFGNAVRRTVSVIQKKYGFETEGQAVQYAIDDLDAGIKKQKEEVTKLQEVEKAYSNNKASVKAVETEGSGDLAKNKKIRVHGGKDANGQDIWKDVVLSTRTNEMKNAIERAKEHYNNLSTKQSVKKVNSADAEFGMLSTLIRTIVSNGNPTDSPEEKSQQINDLEKAALDCETYDEAYNKIITMSTQRMNLEESDYGREQGAAALLNLLYRNAGITIDGDAYSSQAIENEYNSLMRELNNNPNRYSEEVKDLQNAIANFTNNKEAKDFNEESIRKLSNMWKKLKAVFEKEQAVHARETADANDALQEAQHEKEAFQRYIENTIDINNDKYGGSGK